MASIPTFSLVSAISEVFVTIAVLWAVIANARGQKLMWRLLGAVLAFELCVNVVYMTGRAKAADVDVVISAGMKAFYALHGILSLLMFLSLAFLYIRSVLDMKDGRETWFRRHPSGTWVFVFFWMVSVSSGEIIFYLRYLA